MAFIPPFRLKVLMELSDLLRTITPANGYQMDLSDEGCVVRGKMFIGDDQPDYMISLLEPPSAVEAILNRAPDNTLRAGEWDVLVQGWARNQPGYEDCDLAYVLQGDVHKALATQKKEVSRPGYPGTNNMLNMSGKVTDMKIGSPVIRPTEEVSDFGVFYTILTMKISEDTARPLR